MFSSFLKPKWQHSNPGIRKAAVDRLSVSDDGDIEILNRIAQEDPDTEVRCAAISRINSLALLQSIVASETGEKVLKTANAQLSDVLMAKVQASPPLADRIAVLKEIGNGRIAEAIIKDAEELELQVAALDYVEDPELLCSVALSAPSAALRQAAASRVEDQELLHDLAKSSKKHDKNVYRIVNQKLTEIRDSFKEASQSQSRKEHLLKAMELLSKSSYSSLYSAKYHQLDSQWRDLDNLDSPGMEQRYQQAKSICEATITQHDAQDLEQQKQMELSRTCHEARGDLLHSIEGPLDGLKQSPYAGEPAISELLELLGHCQAAWKLLARDLPPTQQEQKRFDQASQSLAEFIVAVQGFERKLETSGGLMERAEALLNREKAPQPEQMQQTRSSLEEIIARNAWPKAFPPSASLSQANKAVDDLGAAITDARKIQSQILERVDAKLEKLSRYIDEGTVKSANGLAREVRGLINQLGTRKTPAIGKQFAHLCQRLDELNDWKNFAATPKKEELITKMEALIDSDLPMQNRANLIRELEDEWKSLGRGGKDKAESDELWNRFKQAADAAYEPCKQYFSDLRKLRKENLQQRKIICDELEHFIESVNWEAVDWKRMEEIVRLGREEWRKFSPVDRSAGKSVQQRFDRLIGGINEKLNTERKANVQIKHELVQQMEALVENEDLNSAINAAKRLQREWSRVGITHRSDDRRLWKAFRAACDQVFGRRTLENQARDEERIEQLSLAEALCEKLEQVARTDLSSWDNSAVHLDEISREFNGLGPLPRDSQAAVKSRFEEAVQGFKKRAEQYQKAMEEQKVADAKSLSDRCAEIEYRVMSGEQEELDGEIEQLRAELAASSNDAGFISAIRSRVDNAADCRGNPDQLTSELDANLHALHMLCIRLEVLTQTESPPEDQELRMTYQVNRLSESMQGMPGKPDPTPEQLSELGFEWLATGPVERQVKSQLQNRWDRVMENYH